MKKIDMTGVRVGRLVVIGEKGKDKRSCPKWECLCDCGNTVVVAGSDLRRKRRPTTSCGCYRKERINLALSTHGMKNTPEYAAWASMKTRCSNPNSENYHYYGGRGINYCHQWENFENFIEDMGLKPFPNYSLDRIDNDGDYTPENCRWTTTHVQNINQSLDRRNKTGFQGIHRRPNGKYQASYCKNCLGYFDKLSDAVFARVNAEIQDEEGVHQ